MPKAKGQPHEYTAFFEANENGGYTVTVPALSGLVTEGKDLEDAPEMAKNAIRCHIEGLKKAKKRIPIEREKQPSSNFSPSRRKSSHAESNPRSPQSRPLRTSKISRV